MARHRVRATVAPLQEGFWLDWLSHKGPPCSLVDGDLDGRGTLREVGSRDKLGPVSVRVKSDPLLKRVDADWCVCSLGEQA